MKTRKSLVLLAAVVFTIFAIPVLAATHYFQGFETDTFDWTGATQVASTTNGVPSAAGDFHAEAANGAFTRFGGYESTFPQVGIQRALTCISTWT